MNTRLIVYVMWKNIYSNTQAGQLKSTKTPLTYLDTHVHAHTWTHTRVLHGITSRDIYIRYNVQAYKVHIKVLDFEINILFLISSHTSHF